MDKQPDADGMIQKTGSDGNAIDLPAIAVQTNDDNDPFHDNVTALCNNCGDCANCDDGGCTGDCDSCKVGSCLGSLERVVTQLSPISGDK